MRPFTEVEGVGAEVGGSEPEVVAAVARSVAALQQRAGLGEAGEKAATMTPEAREVARVVLASRTIRSHVVRRCKLTPS